MKKILYVEDNEMNRDMLTRRLKRKGFKIDAWVDLYSCAVIISCSQLLFGLVATIIASKIPRRKLFMGCGVIVLTGTLIIGTTVYLNRL